MKKILVGLLISLLLLGNIVYAQDINGNGGGNVYVNDNGQFAAYGRYNRGYDNGYEDGRYDQRDLDRQRAHHNKKDITKDVVIAAGIYLLLKNL